MRGITRRRAAVTGVVIVVLAGVGAWHQRRLLADGAIADALTARGVRASYRVAGIGLRWERLENIVIGDPRAPDLIADWAEIRVVPTFGGLTATAIRAHGVRLRGRLVGGKVSFGALERLIPASTGGPFTLPDLAVDLSDARIALATRYGDIGARLDGKGNLAKGFTGKLAAIAPTLAIGGCRAERATLYVDLTIANRRPTVAGPLRASGVTCGTSRFASPALELKVALSEALDHWQGTSAVAFGSLSSGAGTMAGLTGWLAFAGDARETKGTAQVGLVSALHPMSHATGLTLDGKFAVRGGDVDTQGTVKAARVVVDRPIDLSARAVAGPPVGPLITKLNEVMDRAGRNLAVTADVAARVRGAQFSAILTTADVSTAQGMKLHVGGGRGVGYGPGGIFADTGATLAGGGFPSIVANMRRSESGETQGVVRVSPYTAGSARLVLAPVRFEIAGNGAARVQTTALIDGPVGDGRVGGLRLPVALTVARGGTIALNPGCTRTSFQTLAVTGLSLAPASFNLCAKSGALVSVTNGRTGGGAVIIAPRLTGRLGAAPIAITAARAALALGNNRFAVGDLKVRLGTADRITRLDLTQLAGTMSAGGIAGSFGGLSGKIANVPLLIDAGAGGWTFRRGVLTLDGKARVADEAQPARFNPMSAEAVKLRLADNRITMTGTLHEPLTHTQVAAVTIQHDLTRGTGDAKLDVARLTFGKSLQPEKLTSLTLGVVANVVGSVTGQGLIRWTPAGVTSTGTFGTSGLDLAAAFGPVTGAAGQIVFTDLLGLVTAPGQTLSIAVVNPGIPVPDGRVSYHLAAGQRIVVEGGRWPFAGGALILDPTVLDMGVTKERRLTFRVERLDAAKFIEQLKFENLSATGIFDGAMPMIFDDQGGRIVGGKVTARAGGGTLSYVGDISNAKMNVFAKLAFDALKSIRYNNLSIEMDGALDGEIISKVNFRGVNEAPQTEKRSYLARKFSNLPFIFNITIRAPFRGLLNTARTLQDPSALLQGLPLRGPQPPVPQPPVPPTNTQAAPIIQPPASGKRP
ncbi:YdbH domain-containing protein [Sphingomonas sp.]|uniref:YdbH domain-containing protein n=1 Tax=Sphingomonas sp. TaxID=28214 RepID=UPI0025F24D6D|nr:YdbH domain-containing protein [Sphingomonas sp.]